MTTPSEGLRNVGTTGSELDLAAASRINSAIQREYLNIRFRGDSETVFFALPDPNRADDYLRHHVKQHGFGGWVSSGPLTLNMQEVAAFFVSLGPSNPEDSAAHEDRPAAAAPVAAGTPCTFRYPKADPVQRFAILDLTEPQFRMLINAAESGIEDPDPEDYETAAELTAILQQAREALDE